MRGQRWMGRRSWLSLLLVLGWASGAAARAPDTFEEHYAIPTIIESPQWWVFEAKVGPYQPGDSNDAFSDVYRGDRGWLLAAELDFKIMPIPYVGQLDLGAGWGWADYDAGALTASGRAGEETTFTMFPISVLGVLRVDALSRALNIPLLFAGKVGYDFVRWKTKTANSVDASGLNTGLRWALQAGLELDIFDRSSARALDEDFGINHTFLLFELMDSLTDDTGDRSFSFGLGASF